MVGKKNTGRFFWGWPNDTNKKYTKNDSEVVSTDWKKNHSTKDELCPRRHFTRESTIASILDITFEEPSRVNGIPKCTENKIKCRTKLVSYFMYIN